MTRFMLLSVVFVGMIAQAAVGDIVLTNGTFEEPVLPTGTNVEYASQLPDGVPGWGFTARWNGGGVFKDGANGMRCMDDQGGFIGDLGQGWQDVTVTTAGDYALGFYGTGIAAASTALVNPLQFTLGGTTITFSGETTVAPPQNSIAWYISDTMSLTPGTYELRIIGTLSGSCSGFDNMTLIGGTTPEPSSLVLFATGLLSLVCYAWRKQK